MTTHYYAVATFVKIRVTVAVDVELNQNPKVSEKVPLPPNRSLSASTSAASDKKSEARRFYRKCRYRNDWNYRDSWKVSRVKGRQSSQSSSSSDANSSLKIHNPNHPAEAHARGLRALNRIKKVPRFLYWEKDWSSSFSEPAIQKSRWLSHLLFSEFFNEIGLIGLEAYS